MRYLVPVLVIGFIALFIGTHPDPVAAAAGITLAIVLGVVGGAIWGTFWWVVQAIIDRKHRKPSKRP